MLIKFTGVNKEKLAFCIKKYEFRLNYCMWKGDVYFKCK